MGVHSTGTWKIRSNTWQCDDCSGVFISLFAADSDTQPVCPYCRIATLESSHAELLEALKAIYEILAFYEGSEEKPMDISNHVVLINAEPPDGDFQTMLSVAVNALAKLAMKEKS